MSEIALQQARPTVLPVFRSYNVRPSGDKWVEDQLPTLIIVNAGLDGRPVHAGDGQYDAPFRIGCVIFARGNDPSSARHNAEDYAAAVRAILLQKRGQIGCSDIVWDGESYDENTDESARTVGSSVVEFVITVPGVVFKNKGPSAAIPPTPDTLPGSNWPKVELPKLDVKKRP